MIIGLVVGGVLVGQNLISAAAVRAQVSQLEKYNTAVNTFRNKYGGLPGDLQLNAAVQFNFNTSACAGTQGSRDGNGIIDGAPAPGLYSQTQGETALFWQDLSNSNLIAESIPGGGATIACPSNAHVTNSTPGSSYVGNFFPPAKIGNGNFIYAYENGGSNYFGLLGIQGTDGSGSMSVAMLLTVAQAYAIDTKMDDGIPTSGNVTASYVNTANSAEFSPSFGTPDTATTCFHVYLGPYYNPGYSITVNNGAGVNCALSFRFQ